jgi:hypothetical protein
MRTGLLTIVLFASAPVEMASATEPTTAEPPTAKAPKRASTYRPWAELLKRNFGVDVF